LLICVDEQNLRKRISELQEYRRMGITTAAEAESYETIKAARVGNDSRPNYMTLTSHQAGYRAMPPRERLDVIPSGARINAGQNRHLQGVYGTPPPGSDPKRVGDSREPTPRVLARRPGESESERASQLIRQSYRSTSPIQLRWTCYLSKSKACAQSCESCPSRTS
jgi:hypothetical protein